MLYLDSILSEATYINHGTIFGIFGAQIGSRTSPGELLVNNENPWSLNRLWLPVATTKHQCTVGLCRSKTWNGRIDLHNEHPTSTHWFLCFTHLIRMLYMLYCIYHKIQLFAHLFINQLWYQSRQTAVLVKAWLNCWWEPGYAPFLRMKPIVWS